MEELLMLCQQIMLTLRAEDLFGAKDIVLHPLELKKFLRIEYEKFHAKLDSENFLSLDEIEIGKEAQEKLLQLYEDAERRIDRYQFALPGYEKEIPQIARRSPFKIGDNQYFKGALLYETDSSCSFQGYLESQRMNLGEVEIKLAQSSSDNRSFQNEIRILDTLHSENVPQWKHFPLVLDRFMVKDRVGVVFRKLNGYSLETVRNHHLYQKGVDRRDMIWMFDRILSALGYVHRKGIVHGNLTPETIMIQTYYHNAFVTDWTKAVLEPAISGEKIESFSDIFSAPEVKTKGKIGPWSDLYSLGKIMIWFLGGDPAENQIPESVEEPLSNLLLEMVKESEYQRPSDAWAVYDKQADIKDRLWGRKYRHFSMD